MPQVNQQGHRFSFVPLAETWHICTTVITCHGFQPSDYVHFLSYRYFIFGHIVAHQLTCRYVQTVCNTPDISDSRDTFATLIVSYATFSKANHLCQFTLRQPPTFAYLPEIFSECRRISSPLNRTLEKFLIVAVVNSSPSLGANCRGFLGSSSCLILPPPCGQASSGCCR